MLLFSNILSITELNPEKTAKMLMQKRQTHTELVFLFNSTSMLGVKTDLVIWTDTLNNENKAYTNGPVSPPSL